MKNGECIKRTTISASPDGVSPLGSKLIIGKDINLNEAKYLVNNSFAKYETGMAKIPKDGDSEAAEKIKLAEELRVDLVEKATELRIEVEGKMDNESIQLAIDEVEALSPQEKAARTRELNKAADVKLEEARKATCEGCPKLPDNCVGVKDCEKFDDEGVPVTKSTSWS